jgi:hypothetical protein
MTFAGTRRFQGIRPQSVYIEDQPSWPISVSNCIYETYDLGETLILGGGLRTFAGPPAKCLSRSAYVYNIDSIAVINVLIRFEACNRMRHNRAGHSGKIGSSNRERSWFRRQSCRQLSKVPAQFTYHGRVPPSFVKSCPLIDLQVHPLRAITVRIVLALPILAKTLRARAGSYRSQCFFQRRLTTCQSVLAELNLQQTQGCSAFVLKDGPSSRPTPSQCVSRDALLAPAKATIKLTL